MKLSHIHESSDHTCRFQYRKPEDDSWARRNSGRCEACKEEYEREDDNLDSGFIGDIPDELKPEPEPTQDDILQRIKDLIKFDPRQHHKPGAFGTGRPASIKASDSPAVAAIKIARDAKANRDPVTGKGIVKRDKDKCGHNHTCTAHPSGRPAWNYPMPDPVATLTTGKQRYNWMFKYSPKNTFDWPVSGMMGFEPKDEYRDYVMSKLECPVCSGEAEGCDNPVAQEYTAEKPFCTDHLDESPYPKELRSKYGRVGPESYSTPGSLRNPEWEKIWPTLPQARRDKILALSGDERAKAMSGALESQAVKDAENRLSSANIKVGSKVQVRRGRYKKYGVAKVVERDLDMDDDEILIEWPPEKFKSRVYIPLDNLEAVAD